MGGWQGVLIAAMTLAWLAGVALPMHLPRLDWPALPPALALASLAAGLLAVKAWRRAGRHRLSGSPGSALSLWPGAAACSLGLALAMAGAAQTFWRAEQRLAERLPAPMEGLDLRLSGRIEQMPQLSADGLRFVFTVASARQADGRPVAGVPPRVWLHWGRGWQDDALLSGPPQALHAGERWELPVRLRQPHGLLNPHGFDAELWLFEQRIGAVGSVRATAPQDPRRLAAAPRWWAAADEAWSPLVLVEGWRERLRDQLLLALADSEHAGVIAALAVGDQAAIDGPQWDVFRQTGVAHLMSISGLHITLFAALASAAVGGLWRRRAGWCLRCPAPVAARWSGVLLALAYALLSGWGVPAQRTVWMLLLAAAVQGRGWRWPPLLVCLLAAAWVAAIDPWALMQPGYWLSFGAVALLMLSEPVQRSLVPAPAEAAEPAAPAEPAEPAKAARLVWQRWGPALQSGLRSQLVASLGLAPLSMLLFHQLSPVGLLANLLAVPWVTLVVTPLALAGLAWAPLWQLAALAQAPLMALLTWLAGWAGAGWLAPAVPAWAAAAGLLGSIALLLPVPWRLRVLGLPLLLPLAWPSVPRPAPGRFELVAVDVGQGSAVLVRTARHLLVHDAGPQFSRDSDAGRRVLLPLLWARGERQIDELQLSHRDLDHVGGAAALLDGLPVARLRSSLEPEHPLRQRPLPQLRCEAGQRWTWDGVQFEVLHPQAEPAGGENLSGGQPQELGKKLAKEAANTRSCVLRVQGSDGQSALLTGDIEAPQEARLVARYGSQLASQVLVVPHHGSQTSSSARFLAAVQPEVAVIQVGHRSRFGHPHPAVLARYAQFRIPVVRTDHCGGWIWGDDGAYCTRVVHHRHWHWSPPAVPPAGGAVVARVPWPGEHE